MYKAYCYFSSTVTSLFSSTSTNDQINCLTFGEHIEVGQLLDNYGNRSLDRVKCDSTEEKHREYEKRIFHCSANEGPKNIVECLQTNDQELLKIMLDSSKLSNNIKDFLIPPTNEFILAKYEAVNSTKKIINDYNIEKNIPYVSAVKYGAIILLRILPKENTNLEYIIKNLNCLRTLDGKDENYVIETLVNWKDKKQHQTLQAAQKFIDSEMKNNGLNSVIRYGVNQLNKSSVGNPEKKLKDLFQIEFIIRLVKQFLTNAGYIIKENHLPNYQTNEYAGKLRKYMDFQKASNLTELCSNLFNMLPDLVDFKYYVYSLQMQFQNYDIDYSLDLLHSKLCILNEVTINNFGLNLFISIKKIQQMKQILKWNSKFIFVNKEKNIPMIQPAYEKLKDQGYWFVVVTNGMDPMEKICIGVENINTKICGYLKHSPLEKSKNKQKIFLFSCPEKEDDKLRIWICNKCFQLISCSGDCIICSCGKSRKEDCEVQCFHKDHGEKFVPLVTKSNSSRNHVIACSTTRQSSQLRTRKRLAEMSNDSSMNGTNSSVSRDKGFNDVDWTPTKSSIKPSYSAVANNGYTKSENEDIVSQSKSSNADTHGKTSNAGSIQNITSTPGSQSIVKEINVANKSKHSKESVSTAMDKHEKITSTKEYDVQQSNISIFDNYGKTSNANLTPNPPSTFQSVSEKINAPIITSNGNKYASISVDNDSSMNGRESGVSRDKGFSDVDRTPTESSTKFLHSTVANISYTKPENKDIVSQSKSSNADIHGKTSNAGSIQNKTSTSGSQSIVEKINVTNESKHSKESVSTVMNKHEKITSTKEYDVQRSKSSIVDNYEKMSNPNLTPNPPSTCWASQSDLEKINSPIITSNGNEYAFIAVDKCKQTTDNSNNYNVQPSQYSNSDDYRKGSKPNSIQNLSSTCRASKDVMEKITAPIVTTNENQPVRGRAPLTVDKPRPPILCHQTKNVVQQPELPPLTKLPNECRDIFLHEPKNIQKTSDSCYNVLLIGQSGVGKSSLLNAFKNYLIYSTADEALKNKLEYMIPCQFPVYTEDGEEPVIIGENDINEVYHENADNSTSTTQKCRIHPLEYSGQRINFIDTPGLTDTRGFEQDQQNLNNIYETIVSIDKLHAVCFVLKPNESKLEVGTENTLRDLLFLFPKTVTNRIIYLFTHTRSTLYRPGNSASMLRKFSANFQPTRNVKLPTCNKETVFCFDNEAFRFLCAKSKNVDYPFATLEDYRISWDKSRISAFNFLNQLKKMSPLMTNEIQLMRCLQSTLVRMHDIIQKDYSTSKFKRTIFFRYYQIAAKLDALDMALFGKNHLNCIDEKKLKEVAKVFEKQIPYIIADQSINFMLNSFLSFANDPKIQKFVRIMEAF